MVKSLHFWFDFFLSAEQFFFFKGVFGVIVFRLPCFFFFKKKNNGKVISFFFSDTFSFMNFLSSFFRLYNSSFVFFFSRLRLHGLGYRFKLFSRNFARLFMGTINYIYFHCPSNVLIRVRRRKLLLISNSLSLLRLVVTRMLLLKILVPYALRGVFFPKQIVLLKPGKKKF